LSCQIPSDFEEETKGIVSNQWSLWPKFLVQNLEHIQVQAQIQLLIVNRCQYIFAKGPYNTVTIATKRR